MTTLIGEAATFVRTRARRRALVCGFYLSFAASIAAAALGRRGGGAAGEVVACVLLAAAFAGYMVLMHLTHHSRTNPAALLDERGRAVRDQAYRRAYGLAVGTVAAGMLYAWGATLLGRGWTPAGHRDWAGLLAVAIYLLISYPPAVIAWTETDVPVEDPEDEEMERRVLRGVPLPPAAWRLMLGLTAAAVVVAGAQLAGAGLFPERYGDSLAGLATGLLFGAGLLWGFRRRGHNP